MAPLPSPQGCKASGQIAPHGGSIDILCGFGMQWHASNAVSTDKALAMPRISAAASLIEAAPGHHCNIMEILHDVDAQADLRCQGVLQVLQSSYLQIVSKLFHTSQQDSRRYGNGNTISPVVPID